MRASACLLLAVLATGCSAATSTLGSSPSTLPSATLVAAQETSVVCEWFGRGQKLLIDVFIQDLRRRGGLDAQDPAPILRSAIDLVQGLAERASGEEKDDLATLAQALDDAALTADYGRVQDPEDAFFTKYHEQCGED